MIQWGLTALIVLAVILDQGSMGQWPNSFNTGRSYTFIHNDPSDQGCLIRLVTLDALQCMKNVIS